MADAADFLLAVYAEHMTQARWHEEQREKVSTLVFAGSGALLALAAVLDPWQRGLVYALVAALGLIGAVIALKHYERNRRHVGAGRALRERLDALLPDAAVGPALRPRPPHESPACRILEGVRLYLLWSLLNAFVACLGLTMLLANLLHG